MKKNSSKRAKLEKPLAPKIVQQLPSNMPKGFGTGSMVIVTPLLVDGLVRTIPKGKIATIGGLREKFAHDFNTDITCPLTTGIFLRICAEAAQEDLEGGRTDITPYWRVIRDDGTMIDKFPGGIEQQAENLKKEGFEILVGGRGGKKLTVANYTQNKHQFL